MVVVEIQTEYNRVSDVKDLRAQEKCVMMLHGYITKLSKVWWLTTSHFLTAPNFVGRESGKSQPGNCLLCLVPTDFPPWYSAGGWAGVSTYLQTWKRCQRQRTARAVSRCACMSSPAWWPQNKTLTPWLAFPRASIQEIRIYQSLKVQI